MFSRPLTVSVSWWLVATVAVNAKSLKRLEREANADIALCMMDQASEEFFDRIPTGSFDLWGIPFDLTGQSADRVQNLQPTLDIPGVGNNLPQGLQWLAAGIPPTLDEGNEIEYFPGLPPGFDPTNPYGNMLPPFFHQQKDPAKWGYNKWPALPFDIMAYFRLDAATYQSGDARNTLFLKNLADRGSNNKLKKQYLSALTCDKWPLYEPKITAAIAQFKCDVISGGMPVLGAWRKNVFDLYYSLHFAVEDATEVPSFVKDWVDDISSQLGFQINGGNSGAENRVKGITNYCRSPHVDAWIEERRLAILADDDDTTFTYWWDKAGIPAESLVFEAAHNVVAWSNIVNTFFLLIRAQLQDIIGINNVASFLGGASQTIGPIDFFDKYNNEATTDNEKMDVTREAFRLLLPSFLSFSFPDTTEETKNDGKKINDADFDTTESFHFHILIQAMNDEYSVGDFSFSTKAGTYDTSRYGNFQPSGGCPFATAQDFDVETEFVASGIDHETIVPRSHPEFFPVFPTGQLDFTTGIVNGPKYCPFGLGYRKCPAELFNTLFLGKILEGLKDFTFTTNASLFDVIKPGVEGWETAIPVGLSYARDNIEATTTEALQCSVSSSSSSSSSDSSGSGSGSSSSSSRSTSSDSSSD